MGKDDVWCFVCQKAEPRKLARLHEMQGFAESAPAHSIPGSSGNHRRKYTDLATDSDSDQDMNVPPSPLPDDHMDIDVPVLPSAEPNFPSRHVTIEDDSEDEDGPAMAEDDPEFGDSDGEADEMEHNEFMDVNWEELAREVEALSSLDQMGGEFEQHLQQVEKKLSELDIRICKAFAFRMKHNLTDNGFEDIGPALLNTPLPSLAACRSRISLLAGFTPEFYDCCSNSCCCFVAQYANDEVCSFCKEPRFQDDGTPRQRFMYLPIIPRLIQLFSNRDMATVLRERTVRTPVPGEFSDVFDGSHYKELCKRNIHVRGKEIQPIRKYFADMRDLAIGLSTDGFCPHRRRKTSAWPLIAFLYDLPPDVRFHIDNIISLGVIPGPNKPKNIDSFLFPFVCEMEKLAHGVRAVDILESDVNKAVFSLRAFLIVAFGDIPAVSALMGMKGHNAYSPCRMCTITGVAATGSKHLYVPLNRLAHHRHSHNDDIPIYDALHLPLRTHNTFKAQAEEVMSSSRISDANTLARKYGIKHLSILFTLDSMRFPACFPYDFMHLIWENLIKNLVLHWTDDFKDIGPGREAYTVEKTVWETVGRLTHESGASIPSAYGTRVPNIAADRTTMSAEMWSLWTLFLGPMLLRRFLKPQYHAHFVSLVVILNKCLQFTITVDEVEEIRIGLAQWVKEYERIYYQYDAERVSTCPLTVHALLHIADSILILGPVWCYWAFPMERFCGMISPHIRSRRYPWRSIDRFVLERSQLAQIQLLYPELKPHLAWLHRRCDGDNNDHGAVHVPGYDSCILLPPAEKQRPPEEFINYTLVPALTTKLGPHVNFVRRHIKDIFIEEYGRIRRTDTTAGDTMRSCARKRCGSDIRDDTWVRYTQQVDANETRRNAPEELHDEEFYGQLEHIVHLRLPPSTLLAFREEADSIRRALLKQHKPIPSNLDQPIDADHIFVSIRGMRISTETSGLEALDVHYIASLNGPVHCVDAISLQCLIGRVYDGQRWACIDRSGGLARTWTSE